MAAFLNLYIFFSFLISFHFASNIIAQWPSIFTFCSPNINNVGYVTEGNTTGNSDFAPEKTTHLIAPSQFGKTPRIGMMSAKAKSRRSRSAGPHQGSILGSAMKSRRPTAADHSVRMKLKTPIPRPRATSADNEKVAYEPKTPPRSPGSPATWLRWPKPGEKIISITGTPLVSHSYVYLRVV